MGSSGKLGGREKGAEETAADEGSSGFLGKMAAREAVGALEAIALGTAFFAVLTVTLGILMLCGGDFNSSFFCPSAPTTT